MENDCGFKDWFYQTDEKPRLVNFFDSIMNEHLKVLETLFEVCYNAGYRAGWEDKEDTAKGLDA